MSTSNDKSLEIWKPIEGYEGLYEVSDLGNVRSLYSTPPLVLKPSFASSGYRAVGLSVNDVSKTKKISRMVGKAFVPNPENKPNINHINGIKTDDRAVNLEWCTQSENVLHSFRMGLQKQKIGYDHPKAKEVIQMDKVTGEEIARFGSTIQAGKLTGIDQSSISACCLKKLKKTGGYAWKFANE